MDRSKFEENEDIVVMKTKLKILEILQVAGPGVWWGVLGRGRGRGAGPGGLVGVSPSGTASRAGRLHTEPFGPVILKVVCLAGSISLTWGLRSAGSWALPRFMDERCPEAGCSLCGEEALLVVLAPAPRSGCVPSSLQTGEGKWEELSCSHTDFEAELEVESPFPGGVDTVSLLLGLGSPQQHLGRG